MLNKIKNGLKKANSRTKALLAVLVVYGMVMVATVSASAVNTIVDFIPTVDIELKDGVQETKNYLVKQDTVENVLEELNVNLNKDDKINKELTDIVQDKDLIEITRLESKEIVKTEKIPYTTKKVGSGTWSVTVTQEGQNGKVKRTYLVNYSNGKEISRTVVKEKIIKEPVEKIIKYGGIEKGTKFSGRLTTFGGDCTGCGGSSASGVKLSAKNGVNNTDSPFLMYRGQKYYCLAADRSIPFGTVIKITNHNLNLPSTIYGIVVDRGGAITGNKIDIFKGSERGGRTYFSGSTSYNTQYEIVSVGSGRASFWR